MLVDGLVEGIPVEGLPPNLPIVVHVHVQIDFGGTLLECDILLEVPLINDLNLVCDPVSLININAVLTDQFGLIVAGVSDLNV